MLSSGETKIEKEKFYTGKKKKMNICDVNVDNIVISKLVVLIVSIWLDIWIC